MRSHLVTRDAAVCRRLIFLCLAAVLGFAACSKQPQPPADPVQQVMHAMQDAMGGKQNWEKARYLRFDWVVESDGKEIAHVQHLTDRWDGRYRVEWRNKEGKTMQALFNANTRRGKMFVDGQPVAPTDSGPMMERAYARFINDSYWLLMPWKLDDPKVMLSAAGDTTIDGQAYDVLHLKFDHVGLTPGDQYWAFVNRKTHLMDRWAYFLEDMPGVASEDSATAWSWSDWEKTGGIMLARDRRAVRGGARIHFPVCEVLPSVEDRVFASLDVPMPDVMPAPAAAPAPAPAK
jgi:hypothetical protein